MKGLLWDKPGMQTEASIMRFLAGDDIVLDRALIYYDILATSAHVNGLARIGMLSLDEARAIGRTLGELSDRLESGAFTLDDRFEDGHSAIEWFLIDRLGEVGRRVHLGRSRNDQVLVASRLFMLDALALVQASLVGSAEAAIARAREHADDPMPGYTHLQRAVPSTIGLWMASFAESFIESAELIGLTSRWLDRSPLGTAAGYGVNLPLDREGVADELGFAALQINPMAAQASRGKFEHQALAALWQAMQDIRRLAWDLSLFTTAEFGFVEMPASSLTGSSIMPNKKNPDLAEVLRGSAAIVGGALSELQQVAGLPSGYHRDLQLTKGAMVRACRVSVDAAALVPDILGGTTFRTDRMRGAIDRTMLATDAAVRLAASGVPFRNAYATIASALGGEGGDGFAELDDRDGTPIERRIDESVASRTSPGSCSDLRLDDLAARLGSIPRSRRVTGEVSPPGSPGARR